jgi:hypothetical protein
MLRMKTVSLDMFFDTERVVRTADVATRKNLSKAGAVVAWADGQIGPAGLLAAVWAAAQATLWATTKLPRPY